MAQILRGRNKRYLQYDLFGEIYAGDAERVGKYGFPQLSEEQWIPTQAKSFNYLMSLENPNDWWVHCFCDDYQFERLWTGFDFYVKYILKAKGFISTDFSLYRDYSDDWLIWNCYRNRVMAYAIQKAGGMMIPTAGFGPERTWSWCFDGLPHNSTVAITTNGTLNDPEARRIFVGGVDAMVHTVFPSGIVVCGKYPEWLNTKYPNIKIIPILSHSQEWQVRRCV